MKQESPVKMFSIMIAAAIVLLAISLTAHRYDPQQVAEWVKGMEAAY